MIEHAVQWYVSIDSAFYMVTYLEPGPGWRLVQLQGRRPGAMYEVQALADGATTCSCPDGVNRVLCKHVVALRALGTIPTNGKRAAT